MLKEDFKVVGNGRDEADARSQAGQDDDERQNQGPVVPQVFQGDGHEDGSPRFKGAFQVAVRLGASVRETVVDGSQQQHGNQAGADEGFEGLSAPRDAAFLDGGQGPAGENQAGQHVHGVIAFLEALEEGIRQVQALRMLRGKGRPQEHAEEKQDQAEQQGWRQDFAEPVDDLALVVGHIVAEKEIEGRIAEQGQGRRRSQMRRHDDFIAEGRRARNREEGADDKTRREQQDFCIGHVDRAGDVGQIVGSRKGHGEDRHQGKADAGDAEAERGHIEIAPGQISEQGREHQVPGAEKAGKQDETDGQ